MPKAKNSIKKYNPSEVENKWREVWKEEKIYSPDLDKSKNPFYNLMMFPYPSAEGMHVGNMYAFTGADVHGRFQRMNGKDVFEPIGLDGFGIHSENYAIKVGKHPVEQAKISEANFYKQLKSIGNGFDFTRTVETYKPEYYKWTQWLFIQLFKAGLAYRKKAPVNFCPSCKTVLADEQVLDGKCERCGTVVEKRDLEQWFFRITKYSDRLLYNLSEIDWTQKIKIAQRQWIGKSDGAKIKFKLIVPNQPDIHFVEVFTTRPDTLYGATFLAVSPELAKKWLDVGWKASSEVKEYINKSLDKRKSQEMEEETEKTGVSSQIYAVNPVNDEKVPVWVADYVLSSYGTGAVMGVPAHDQRDYEFAKKFSLEIRQVIEPSGANKENADLKKASYMGEGKIINSEDWNGWATPESISKVISDLEERKIGKGESQYHLRDWLISRQRYWGPPIPMIYCEDCDWQPVPEKDLPVELPFIKDYKPLGTGKAPLASHPEFYKTKCPNCGKDAKRETDVSDTFLDSAWYFLRYVSTDIDSTAFDRERVKKWLPVNMYIGGAEHSVLHLLYARFITMVLKDLGFIDFEEPFTKFRAHGLIIKDGAKMSKSKGNVVIPDQYIRKFGADTLRTYLMFAGPYSQGGDFRDTGIEGMNRFLKRVWTLVMANLENDEKSQEKAHLQFMHKTIKKVSSDVENLNYNTAIASLMEWYNFLSNQKSVSKEELEVFVKLIAPFAPHLSEELYQLLKQGQKSKFESIHKSNWPKFDPKYLEVSEYTVVIQVNGKLRGSFKIDSEVAKDQGQVEDLAKKEASALKYLDGKKILKTIYIEGKVINFVVA